MNEKQKKYDKHQIITIIITTLAIVAYFLPISSGISATSLNLKHSFNIVHIFRLMLDPQSIVEGAGFTFYIPFIIACFLLILSFVCVVSLLIQTILKKSVYVRRTLAVIFFITVIMAGATYNTSLTEMSKTGNNIYSVYPEFKIVLKTTTGSVNNWCKKIDKLVEEADEVFADYTNKDEIVTKLQSLSQEAAGIDYTASDKSKKKYNNHIFTSIKKMIEIEDQEEIFNSYFKNLSKSVSNISNMYGIGFLMLLLFGLLLTGSTYSEKEPSGFRNAGISVRYMYVGVISIVFFGTLLIPTISVAGTVQLATGLKSITYPIAFAFVGKIGDFKTLATNLGLDASIEINAGLVTAGILLVIASLVSMVMFIQNCLKQKSFIMRRILGLVSAVLYLGGFILANSGLNKCGISLNTTFYMFAGIMVAAAVLPFTANYEKEKYKAFSIINIIMFIIVCAFILLPLWKVIVDSLDASAGYGMKMWPANWNLEGYITVLTYPTIVTPFMVSVLTTVVGTVLGLILSTLGAYVLVQFEMPGRNFLANMLLFTLIFQGGMIPMYLTLQNLGILNTLWAVILPLSINVYNLVLMRNFFEGIPISLVESAKIDGCSPMGIFIRIVLPLSKAALASIGLMFAVGFWNDYTNFKLYIMDSNLYNFQMKLRAMIFSSDLPNNNAISENTLQNAAIMVAIIPFMIIYPFCQKYFVKGVNIGAVKE